MKLKLQTYDIQLLVIALIEYKSNDVLTEDDKQRLQDKLIELNNLCTKENDYTLTITIES